MEQIINKLINVFTNIPKNIIDTYNKFLITNRSKFFFILLLCILLGMSFNNIFDNTIAYSLLISTLAIIIYDYYNYKKNKKIKFSNLDNTELDSGSSSDSGSESDEDIEQILGGGSGIELSWLFIRILTNMKDEFINNHPELSLDNEPFQSVFINSFLIPILGEKGTRIFYKLFTIGITSYILPSYVNFFKNIFGFNENQEEIQNSREIFNDKSTGGIAKIFTALFGIGLPLLLVGSIINLFKLIFDDDNNTILTTRGAQGASTGAQGSSNGANIIGGSNNIFSWLYSLLSNISNIENDIINEINSMLNISTNNNTLFKDEYKITFNNNYNFNINKSKIYQDYNILKINMPNKLSNKSNQIIINKIISLEKLKEEINNLYNLIVNSSKAISLGRGDNIFEDLNGLTEDTMKLLVNKYKEKIKNENKQSEKIKKILKKYIII